MPRPASMPLLLPVLLLLLQALRAQAFYTAGSGVVELTAANFDKEVLKADSVAFVEFFAPWCGHCVQAKPEVERAAKALKGIAKVGAVDMTAHQAVGAPYGVKGFPTFKLFVDGKPSDYNGERTAAAMVDFIASAVAKTAKQRLTGGGGSKSSTKPPTPADNNKKSGGGGGSGNVEEATDDNFDQVVLGTEDMVMVAFTAPWCGHCKNLKPHWAEAAAKLAGTGVRIMNLDATANERTAGKFGIQGFPTIKVFGPGPKSVSDAVNYEGPREADGIVQWALSKFEQLGGQVKAELVEVTDQKAFASACDKKCVLVFVPSLLESSAKERAQLLEALQAQAKAVRHMPFLWVAAGTQPEWERAYGLTFGFPAVLLLREAEGQKLGFVHRGKLSEIAGFATAPRGLSQAVKGGWPTVLASAKWDGKDAPKVVEEDGFDLDAFLKEA